MLWKVVAHILANPLPDGNTSIGGRVVNSYNS
jgi:hypothetical protein